MADKFKMDYDGKKAIKEEVEAIRDSYLEKSDSQNELTRLRTIDSRVKNIPLIVGLSFGIIGTLVFGFGVSIFIKLDLSKILGGFMVGLGLILIILAYPLNNKLHKYLKNKYKDEILSLSEKILNDDNE